MRHPLKTTFILDRIDCW